MLAPGEKGAEERYDLSDALGTLQAVSPSDSFALNFDDTAVAAWLNVFVRKADVVKIACIAQ
jgi:alpha-N-arabinofuranosidase